MLRHRTIDRNAHQVTNFASVIDFLAQKTVPPGISTIDHNDLPIDLLISPTDSTTTIFFFHGAIEPHFTLPVLSGLGISGGLNANRVFISDPTLVLDDTLLLSWYAGNRFQPDLQATLVQIMNKVVSALNSKRTIFFGGSGGGFASLFFAHHFKDSLALVFNPQTSIVNYSEKAVRDFSEKAFNTSSEQETHPLGDLPDSVTHDLCDLYTHPSDVTVAYMQNSTDDAHVNLHLRPFSSAIYTKTKFLTLIEPWRQGHSPPPKELLTQLLNELTVSDDWMNSLVKKGFSTGRVS